jgi:pimeloyl-ACP methyl ester carboxylesterase
MSRPRLLLVPSLSELEWRIRPLLEEWAEVASFDPPGVGTEPPSDAELTEAVSDRALTELDRRGWDSCFVAADEFGTAAAARLAALRPDAVNGLALGHACLSHGDLAINREVMGALTQIAEADYRTYARHRTQTTRGAYDDELVEQFIERVPQEFAKAEFRAREPVGELLRETGVPLLLAEHRDCLVFTGEGFQEAVAAFPDAPTLSTVEKPSASTEFAEALRSFCADLGG